MNAALRGACACGAVRYECTAEPVLSVLCHCRDCQRTTGSGHGAELMVPSAAFAFTSGEPRYYALTGDSGNVVSRGFCVTCGSPLVARSSGFPDLMAIHAGSLDDPGCYQPTQHVFLSSAQPWDRIDPQATAFERMPDFQKMLATLHERQVATESAALQAIQAMFRSETGVSKEAASALFGLLCKLGLVTVNERKQVRIGGA
jgi:hypothetical protein